MSALKEIHHLMKNLKSISNGQAKLVKFEHPKSTIDVYLELSPTDGLYKGGNFLFIIQILPGFPYYAPEAIMCMTPICHPNIDTRTIPVYGTNNVCLNILEDWHESIGLNGLVAGLLYLLYYPQLDDPLNCSLGGLTLEEFESKVKSFMNGESVGEACPKMDLQDIMVNFRKQEDEQDKYPELDDEVKLQEEAMDTSEESESYSPLQNSEAVQLYSLIQHQNSVVHVESADSICDGALNCISQGEITPFSAPENFRQEFNGYKLTNHGTTVIRYDEEQHTPNDFTMSPLLVKRFTV